MYEEDDQTLEGPSVPEKTAEVNRRRMERQRKLQDRDIRKVAAALLAFHGDGALSEVMLESLTEIVRRR